MSIKAFIFTLFFLLSFESGFAASANDSLLIRELIQKIAALQVQHHKNYLPGMFPSYREYHFNTGFVKDDDNIFFTGLVLLTLREARPYLDRTSQNLCDTIFKKAEQVFAPFQNRNGRLTYGFWKTNPPRIFPNAGWLNILNRTQSLPDDMDDTSILLLAMNAPDSVAESVHQIMQQHTNTNNYKHPTNYSSFGNLPAYSTWFGNKIPAQLDVCVLANILYMVDTYRLPYTKADSASLQILAKIIKDRQYVSKPQIISPHYYRTPVILYHISRLMDGRIIPELEQFKHQLINDTEELYASSNSPMDKLILSTALLRWGVKHQETELPMESIEANDFVFFTAGMFSVLPSPFFKLVDKIKIAQFYYYCPAYNTALALENLISQKKLSEKK